MTNINIELEGKVENYNKFAEIIDRKIENYQKKSKKLEKLLGKSNDRELRVDFMLAGDSIKNLQEYKLLMLKDIDIETQKVKQQQELFGN